MESMLSYIFEGEIFNKVELWLQLILQDIFYNISTCIYTTFIPSEHSRERTF